MPTIIPLPAREAHPDRDAEAGKRMGRLSDTVADWDGLDDPEPICGRCGAPIALFPDQGLTWHHFRGAVSTSGPQEIYHPGHEPKVEWYASDEIPVDF
jgi:hypothetical protein